MWHPKKNLDPFLPVFSHFFMSYFDVFGSIFEKSAMTDLPKVIVSICLVTYNICMIPYVCRLTFGLNLSGAWGVLDCVCWWRGRVRVMICLSIMTNAYIIGFMSPCLEHAAAHISPISWCLPWWAPTPNNSNQLIKSFSRFNLVSSKQTVFE